MEDNSLLLQGKKAIFNFLGKFQITNSPQMEEDITLSPTESSPHLTSNEEENEPLAKQFGMEVLTNLNSINISKERYKQIPYSFVKKYMILPIHEENGVITVAVSDPLNLKPLKELKLMLDCQIKAVFCPKEIISSKINECYDQEMGAASQMIAHLSNKKESDSLDDVEVFDLLDETASSSPIIKLLNLILIEAIQQEASDIHFEPFEESLRVRYRIDGVLQNRHSPATEYQAQLLARIKVMAKLDIAERRLPQDGRIKLKMGRREIDFRVSTVPVVNGERIVLRILDKGNVILGLQHIGMIPSTLEKFNKLIHLPEGIVLVTGPTGSGKTTTLYSAITELSQDLINIMTIEDPVEYNLKGIAQIGVRPKINLTFAAGLRHILRQDPDVIMVGEIRDKETAEIAIQSSLTGHLVLSTLHTNDAPSAITRLVDMGIEPYLLSSTVAGVIAQRLVRKICPDCRVPYRPDELEIKNLDLTLKDLVDGCVWKGAGCQGCYHSGYKGRLGLYELFQTTPILQQQIVKSVDAVELRRIAIEQGMNTLRSHGRELVKVGETTISEVLRVIRGTEED